jgi:hypothetical protein
MRVYISGQMRGIDKWNAPAFARAAEIWRRAGHQPFSPAAIAIALGYWLRDGEDIHTSRAAPITAEGRQHLQHVMSMDVACLMAADAIALLPGWENSTGATVEVAIAQFFALQTFDAITMQPLLIPPRPWSNIYILSPTDHQALEREWRGIDAEDMKKARKSLEDYMATAPKQLLSIVPKTMVMSSVCQYTPEAWQCCYRCRQRFCNNQTVYYVQVPTQDSVGSQRLLMCEPCWELSPIG